MQTRGISFRAPHARTLKLKRDNMAYYATTSGSVYHNRLAKLLETVDAIPDVMTRMERFYDEFYVDEVQDLAGHDFNLLMALAKAKVEMLFVGDFYQHTFDTSRDGNVNSSLHADIEKYENSFKRRA